MSQSQSQGSTGSPSEGSGEPLPHWGQANTGRPDTGQASLPLESAGQAPSLGVHTLGSRALPAEAGVWDELRTPQGNLRPAWARFAHHLPLPATGRGVEDDLSMRQSQVAMRIRLDGVTHNVFSDGAGAAVAGNTAAEQVRPWSLELLPMLIDAADWSRIEAGVAQRAQLLEHMLCDLYGPQRLLHEGLLPPSLMLRHSGWLRPMQGCRPVGGQYLYMVAFDIARGPQGAWWVVAQRTQVPSGLGYVLHNRILISSQFGGAFKALRVQRVASSCRLLLDTLEARAAEVSGNHSPRLVLLTPGPYSETYFEHAYLARYLGLTLVEGGDLTVRDSRLYLKTVEGLEPVHGVLRRLDDDWCDPLELRSDSTLGVPGLLQAVRAGNVVLANAPGSGFLESPAVQGFMPGIAQCLTGSNLSLPALPTWWCGEPAAWMDVRGQLPGKLLRSTFPRGGRTSQIHPMQQADVHDDPDAWTVQGRLRFSRAPIWSGGALAPRPAMVRVYAIADGRGGWHVLPGGMTRVAAREDASLSMQRGGTSLDTWVLSERPVDSFTMLPQRLQVDDIARHRSLVSSRTGENLFWLGRYTERTEQMVRLMRTLMAVLAVDRDAPDPVQRALSTLAVKFSLVPDGVPTLVQSTALFERALLAGLSDVDGRHGVYGIAFNLASLDRAAQALRDRLPPEQWQLVSAAKATFLRALRCPPGELPLPAQVLPALDTLAHQLAAITGTQTDRMFRDHGWRLLTVGRLLERLQGLTQQMLCFVHHRALQHVSGVERLLELSDSLISFRARYQRHEDLLALTDMLVLDSANPRSFAGALRRLRTEIGKLPGTPEALQPLLAQLPEQGAGLSLDQLRDHDEPAIAQALHDLSQQLFDSATDLADIVGRRFFVLADDGLQRV